MDIQQTTQDIETIRPYLWEIIAFVLILFSLFLTNIIKKIRWFPAYLCNARTSKNGKYTYRKLQKKYLVIMAIAMSYAGVSWSLLHRYPGQGEDIYVITGVIVVLQWLIVESAFKFSVGTKFEPMANVVMGKLYVPEDATVLMKTVAKMSGGGVEKIVILSQEEIDKITGSQKK